MISTFKQCLIFLVFFLFSPVHAFTSDDSPSVAFLVLIVVVIFLFTMICRCIEESNETESEMRVEAYRWNDPNEQNAFVQNQAIPARVNAFSNFGSQGNVPYQQRK